MRNPSIAISFLRRRRRLKKKKQKNPYSGAGLLDHAIRIIIASNNMYQGRVTLSPGQFAVQRN